MAGDDNGQVDQDLMRAKSGAWAGFLRFGTLSIVGVAAILVLMALFLL
ncbi:MAG: aa3-type cytochrome c oxidase subunit IV [Inquilinaceae bacterium]